MATTPDEIERDIRAATAAGFRDRLLARGQARSIVWRDGILPDDAPSFSPLLTYDLLSYAYALLGMGIRLRELDGNHDIARTAFEHAGSAMEAVIAKGATGDPSHTFHRLIAAAAYHLGRFSAQAYSLLAPLRSEANYAPIERALGLLMLRDLSGLEDEIAAYRLGGTATDAAIIAVMQQDAESHTSPDDEEEEDISPIVDGVDLALTDNFLSAMGRFCCKSRRRER